MEKLLAEVRDPATRSAPESKRSRMVLITGAVGAAAVLVSVAALSFGAVATLATPRTVVQEGPAVPPPGMTPDPSPSTPDPTPASSAAPTPAWPKMVMGEYGMMPYFDVTDDISTIPIPASFSPDEAANGKVWLQQAALDAKCMADKGFTFTYTPYWLRPPRPPGAPIVILPLPKDKSIGTPFWDALWGSADQPLGDDYDWRQAGCHGYSVHVTGMDNEN